MADVIKMGEIGWETCSGFIWLRIGTNAGRWWTLWRTFGSHKIWGISWLSGQLFSSQGHYLMQVVSQSVIYLFGYTVSGPILATPMDAGKTGTSDSVMHRPPNVFYGEGPNPLSWACSRTARRKLTVSVITKRLIHCVFFMVCAQFADAAAARIIRSVVLCGPRGRSSMA